MQIGEKITFPFGKGEKEGVVCKVTPKNVFIKCDFPKHKDKIVRRKISQLTKEKKSK